MENQSSDDFVGVLNRHNHIMCLACGKFYPYGQIDSFKSWKSLPLVGDDFFFFMCKDCNPDRREVLKRLALSWFGRHPVFLMFSPHF